MLKKIFVWTQSTRGGGLGQVHIFRVFNVFPKDSHNKTQNFFDTLFHQMCSTKITKIQFLAIKIIIKKIFKNEVHITGGGGGVKPFVD